MAPGLTPAACAWLFIIAAAAASELAVFCGAFEGLAACAIIAAESAEPELGTAVGAAPPWPLADVGADWGVLAAIAAAGSAGCAAPGCPCIPMGGGVAGAICAFAGAALGGAGGGVEPPQPMAADTDNVAVQHQTARVRLRFKFAMHRFLNKASHDGRRTCLRRPEGFQIHAKDATPAGIPRCWRFNPMNHAVPRWLWQGVSPRAAKANGKPSVPVGERYDLNSRKKVVRWSQVAKTVIGDFIQLGSDCRESSM